MTAPSFPPSAHQHCSAMFFLLFLAGLWAGAQNALAGGGSFVTLPALVLAGLDPRAANITSTVALFPGQVTSGLAARSLVSGPHNRISDGGRRWPSKHSALCLGAFCPLRGSSGFS